MGSISFKIAFPVILAGAFIMVVFMALNPSGVDFSFYIVLSLLFVFIFFYGLSTGQKISLPVKKLLKRAIDLSRGDLKTRVYLETKDEFGELAQIFNKIADDLEKSRSNSENSEKSVDLKVRARTQELEETIDALEQKVKNRTIEYDKIIGQVQNLQQSTEGKESEISNLKKQIDDLKTSLEKPTSPSRKKIKIKNEDI